MPQTFVTEPPRSLLHNLRTPFAGYWVLVMLAAFLLVFSGAILAQGGSGNTIRFDIPSGPLDKVLNRFARQAGVAIAMDADKVSGQTSPGLKGEYPVETGLGLLLDNSGLMVEKSAAGYVLVQEPGRQQTAGKADVAVLPEIKIVGSSEEEDPFDRTYMAPKAFSGTKTNTPLIETPASIQIIPRAVMDDQQSTTIVDALENISGVRPNQSLGSTTGFFLRGFSDSRKTYRNGLLATSPSSFRNQFDTATLESIEVLKGPAAMLFGRIEPGGLINVVSKKPLTTTFNAVEQQFGSYGHYRTEWDFSRPLTADNSLLFRFDGSYQNSDSFRDFTFVERKVFHPSLTWQPTASTIMNFEVEVLDHDYRPDLGIPVVGRRPANVPISRSFGDANTPVANQSKTHVGFNLTHHFNDAWKVVNRALFTFADTKDMFAMPSGFLSTGALLADNRTLPRSIFGQTSNADVYSTNLDLIGNFQLWQTRHQTLVGFDYLQATTRYHTFGEFENPDPALAIDIFNPIANIDPARFGAARAQNRNFSVFHDQFFGVYFQDQITLWDKLHIVGGGRYDWAEVARGRSPVSFGEARDRVDAVTRKDQAFSPRVGILYQFVPWFSVYGNWTQSFGSNNGITAQGNSIKPQTAEQFEVGFKGEFFERHLNATLAFFNLAKKNLLTPDLSTPDPLDSIAIGEQRSRGIELDLTGKITDELSFIGNYAFLDGKVTKDNSGLQGNRFAGIPRHSGSLWLKYDFITIEQLRGFSLGFGAFMVGKRNGDIDNTFALPGYVRLDAFARYAHKMGPKQNLIAQLNVRNLTDKRHFVSVDNFANAAPRDSVYPGAPLTVIGSVRLEF